MRRDGSAETSLDRRCCCGTVILTYQLFIPPKVGLAGQGDFGRILGRSGYAAEDKSATIALVAPKYVSNHNSRRPGWEQFSSEYLFVTCAILLNKIISPDGKLDIVVIGIVQAFAFLAAFAQLLMVTTQYRFSPYLWVVALLVLTDVGYAAYWNSLYAEPASCIFFVLLAWWTKERATRQLAVLGSVLIGSATLVGFHEHVLRRIGRPILILLFISPAIAAIVWIRLPGWRDIELLALLSAGCLTGFLTAALGDAWDNVKHLFLFNLMLDACLIFCHRVRHFWEVKR
jgi:hypothetical protein